MRISVFLLCLIAMFIACESCNDDPQPDPKENEKVETVPAPDFNADSAYAFIEKQVSFGPRIPNSDSHKLCADWLAEKLRSYGAEVIVQQGDVKAYTGETLHIRNIIGQFNTKAKKRIMLYAHWDTRPFADRDDDKANCVKPIDGANDGGSGVGALIEIARLLKSQPVDFGVDIIFFDAEDYGRSECESESTDPNDYTWWCLGSQYWTRNLHVPGYRAKYGILLDMVGAEGAVFNKEGTSMVFAPHIVDKIWNTAEQLGYDDFFKNEVTGTTVDDNLFVSRDANVLSANIVEFHLDPSGDGSYGDYHHTMEDNMSIISRETLKAVGQTVTHVLYGEQTPKKPV